MTTREVIKIDYVNEIRPLLADCLYYYGLNALPEMLRFTCARLVHLAPGPRSIEQTFEKVPSKLLPAFFAAAELYYCGGGFTCDDYLPSLEELTNTIEIRGQQVLNSYSNEDKEYWLFSFMFRDLCAAYKSTGATPSTIRVALEWDLDRTLETVVNVAHRSEESSKMTAYVPPNRR
jgi:hypothetical protein